MVGTDSTRLIVLRGNSGTGKSALAAIRATRPRGVAILGQDQLRREILNVADHRGLTRCYRYQMEFEETLRRHATKRESAEFGEVRMRTWWRDTPNH